MSELTALIEAGDVEGVEAYMASLNLDEDHLHHADERLIEVREQYRRLESRRMELEARLKMLNEQLDESMARLRELGVDSLEEGSDLLHSMTAEMEGHIEAAEKAIAEADRALEASK